MAFVEAAGFEEIIARGVRAVEELPEHVIYAGFSLGVLHPGPRHDHRPVPRGLARLPAGLGSTDGSVVAPG
jgi:hypothetical protein